MSSLSKTPTNNSTEESGWTTYFDDFFNNNDNDNLNNINHKCSNSVSLSTSSLLSDATSLVDKNVLSNKNVEKEFSLNKNGKMGSSFKKRKNIVDQALEDTATSHLNTPKEKRKAIVEDKKNGV